MTSRKGAEFITGEKRRSAARDRDEDIQARTEELRLVATADAVGLGSAATDGENPRYCGRPQVSSVFAASRNPSRTPATSSYPPHEPPEKSEKGNARKNVENHVKNSDASAPVGAQRLHCLFDTQLTCSIWIHVKHLVREARFV